MIKKYLKGKILVMIDAANLESSVKDLGWWIDYCNFKQVPYCKRIDAKQ